jgi:hypothetical protein
MADTTRDKFFDAVNEAYDGWFSAIEAGQARGRNVSRTLLDEARKGERELVALARKWVDAPTNFFENFEAVLDAQARAQRRALDLARDSLSDAGEYGREVQEALRRVIKANGAAGEATVEAVRNAYSSAMDRLRGTEEGAEPSRRRPARPTRVPVVAGEAPAELETPQPMS